MAWILDLDGVVWLLDEPIAGAAGAVADLRTSGRRVLFVSNNSTVDTAVVEEKLARQGIPAEGDVITSAMAAASLVEPGERVLVCGAEGVVAAVRRRGAEPVTEGDADAVMVGLTRAFDYEMLTAAAGAVRRGARFIATNEDATLPTPDGPVPGAGAVLAAVRTAAGTDPVVAGKPHQPMADYVHRQLGDDVAELMVGDRPSTDGRFAETLGCPFGLVLSGVTRPGDPPGQPAPARVASDLGALVRDALASG